MSDEDKKRFIAAVTGSDGKIDSKVGFRHLFDAEFNFPLAFMLHMLQMQINLFGMNIFDHNFVHFNDFKGKEYKNRNLKDNTF